MTRLEKHRFLTRKDRKGDPGTEGKNIFAYSWFQDRAVMEPMIQSACRLVVGTGQSSIRMLGIGSGTGNLEREVAANFSEHGAEVQLWLNDILPIQDDEHVPHVHRLVSDNKHLPIISDQSMDLVVARSVTHYEENTEKELEALGEVHRVLAPGGWFITQVPVPETEHEAALIRAIHQTLPKYMNVQTDSATYDMLSQVFTSGVRRAEQQTERPIEVTRESFIARYYPKKNAYKSYFNYLRAKLQFTNAIAQIPQLIRTIPESQRPGVWVNGEDFGWSTRFVIFECQK